MSIVNKEKVIESLLAMGGKKNNDSIEYISDQLVIRHKKTGIEYTEKTVRLDDEGQHSVVCYRYYSPKEGGKKVFIRIAPDEFKSYEPV